jgi:uncharacterized protein
MKNVSTVVDKAMGHKQSGRHNHPEVVKQLKHAEGLLLTIIDMLHEARTVLSFAQQLQAIENVMEKCGEALVHNRITHSVEDSLSALGARDRRQPSRS